MRARRYAIEYFKYMYTYIASRVVNKQIIIQRPQSIIQLLQPLLPHKNEQLQELHIVENEYLMV